MSHDIVSGVLIGAVANAETFDVGYPSGRAASDYAGNSGAHILAAVGTLFEALDGDFSLAFGSAITVTYTATPTLPAGAAFSLQIDRAGGDGTSLELDCGSSASW